MAFKPLADRVLVRRSVPSTQTPAGLYIPAVAEEKPLVAEVIAVGPGRLLTTGAHHPVAVQVGERVYFGRHAGVEVLGDEGLLLLREDEILAVVE